MEDNSSYVYRHTKPCGEVFYIGIGVSKNFKRAYSTYGRNKHWKNIVDKHGYKVEILASKLKRDVAEELEVFLISEYGRKDLGVGTLVNMTDGGEGCIGQIQSEETKMKRRGINSPRFGKSHSEEAKKRISDKARLRKLSEETKQKLSEVSTRGSNGNAKIVLCTQTGIFYDCAKDASEALNLNYSTLKGFLNGNYKNKTSLIYT